MIYDSRKTVIFSTFPTFIKKEMPLPTKKQRADFEKTLSVLRDAGLDVDGMLKNWGSKEQALDEYLKTQQEKRRVVKIAEQHEREAISQDRFNVMKAALAQLMGEMADQILKQAGPNGVTLFLAKGMDLTLAAYMVGYVYGVEDSNGKLRNG